MRTINVGDSVYSIYVEELEYILGTVFRIDEACQETKVYHVDFGNLGKYEFTLREIKKSRLSELIESFDVDQ